MYLYVHCSVIYNSQDREATQGLINRQMDKEDVEYIYICNIMEYYSAMKKDESLPFTTAWMGLEGIVFSKISLSEKDKYHMVSLICGI